MNAKMVNWMPIGELEEIVDCNLIVNGHADERVISNEPFFNVNIE